MQYTTLGNTGLTVSRICLGCMSYGNPKWRPWVLDEAAAQPFFKFAVDHGINFFDTADMYSLGVSEEVTGRALRAMTNLDETVIATKVFYPMSDRPNMGGLSRKHIVQSCEASLRRLGVDTIDLYQIHRFDPTTPIDEMLAALDHLVHQGKVRYVGASSVRA
jgi:aryl-alcohol dehydrogenase-like predicted oxidoreductase